MFRVSTFGTQQYSLLSASSTQAKVSELQIQATSGKVSRDYTGIANDSRRVITLEETTSKISAYLKNIETTKTRLNLMESSTSQVFSVASDAKTLLTNGLSANNADDLSLHTRANSMLEQIRGLLNVQEDGRYLFSGSDISTPPVNIDSFKPEDAGYDPGNPSVGQAGYYQGDDLSQTVKVDDQMNIDYGVTAADPAFEKLIRGLELVKTYGQPGQINKTKLEEGKALIDQAVRDLPDIQGRIGADLKTLEQTNERHLNTQTFTEESLGKLENVDVAQAITQLNAAMTQLEASYMVTSRMGQTGLWNYLR